jgi:ubiquinone/menaquinone biosynthesis C-methylase UbiE
MVQDGPMTDREPDRGAVRRAYDALAAGYAETYHDELARIPFDRRVVDAAFAGVPPGGRVADVGCGPAQVALHLRAAGLCPVGLDLTPAMLREARRQAPDLPLAVADVLRLPLRTGSCSGALSRFVLHHLPRAAVPAALAEMRRVVARGGALLVVVQGGTGERTVAYDRAGEPDQVVATLYQADELAGLVTAAGFAVVAVDGRAPRPEEHQAPKVYVTARAV